MLRTKSGAELKVLGRFTRDGEGWLRTQDAQGNIADYAISALMADGGMGELFEVYLAAPLLPAAA